MEYFLFVKIIYLIGVLLLFHFFYLYVLSKQTEKWLSVEGKIDKSKVRISYGDDSASYYTDIQYHYIVEGITYVSKRIFYGDIIGKGFSRSVKKIVNKYTEGKIVLVYYNPKYPKKSVLETGIHAVIYRTLITSILFQFISVIMVIKEDFFISLFK